MGGSFNIGSPTVGGGTAFNAILNDWLSLLSQDARGRADVGLGLFGGLLESELSARRRPVSLLDSLLLSQEFGTVLPLSQLPPERSRRFGIREPNPLLGELTESLGAFATGRDERFEQAYESFNRDFTFTDRSDPRGRFEAATRFVNLVGTQHVPEIARRVREAGHDELARALLTKFSDGDGGPAQLQAGGAMVVIPGRKKTKGNRVAGPVRIIDRTGRAVAVAGEGDRPETIRVEPGVRTGGAASAAQTVFPPDSFPPELREALEAIPFGRGGTVGDIGRVVDQFASQPVDTTNLSRDVRFRLQELLSRHPGLSQYQALIGAINPGGVEEALGGRTDPRTQLSRALSGALSADLRFSNPFVRALALGRAPTPTELTARDVSTLPRNLRDRLAEVVGVDMFPDFLFELGMLSPTGTRVRQGTVSGLRI